jgi:hypothetical protein
MESDPLLLCRRCNFLFAAAKISVGSRTLGQKCSQVLSAKFHFFARLFVDAAQAFLRLCDAAALIF